MNFHESVLKEQSKIYSIASDLEEGWFLPL